MIRRFSRFIESSVLALTLVLASASPAQAVYALISNAGAQSTDANAVTTTAIDTTGANLLVVVTSTYASTAVLTDSASNTWSSLVERGTTSRTRIHYIFSPTTSASHTFTSTISGGYPSIYVSAWSGSVTSPFDVENGTGDTTGTSMTTGSITPTENDELVIAALCLTQSTSGTPTIGGGFTITNAFQRVGGSNSSGGGMAYLIQGTAAAANPTWSWTNSVIGGAAIASFKAGAAATSANTRRPLTGVGK